MPIDIFNTLFPPPTPSPTPYDPHQLLNELTHLTRVLTQGHKKTETPSPSPSPWYDDNNCSLTSADDNVYFTNNYPNGTTTDQYYHGSNHLALCRLKSKLPNKSLTECFQAAYDKRHGGQDNTGTTDGMAAAKHDGSDGSTCYIYGDVSAQTAYNKPFAGNVKIVKK